MKSQISGTTQLIGIVANPIRHSISPKMHNAAFEKLQLDYAYLAFEVEEGQLAEAVAGLRALGARGFNVSMPYKSKVIPYLDELSPAATLCQAVNTVVNDAGKLVGHMTDGSGLMQALRDEGFEVRGKKITIVGCGGAGKAIQIQAALDGARELAIFNRSVARGQEMADLINRHTSTKATFYPLGDEALLKEQLATSDLLINATNIGMGELKDQSFIRDSSLLPRDLFVCDIIYNPAKTKLLQQAEERGCRIMNGVGMIIYQGAEAFKKWTHHEMPIEEIKNVLNLKG